MLSFLGRRGPGRRGPVRLRNGPCSCISRCPLSFYSLLGKARVPGSHAKGHPAGERRSSARALQALVMKKPVATKWGSVSLVKAHVALIKEALKNKQTQCAPTSCASMLLADGVLRAVLSPVGLRPLPCADTEVDLFMSGGLCCSAIPAFRLCPSIRSTRSVRTCA